jgi:hypothetical protein
MRFLRSEIAPGRSTFFFNASEHGTMHVRAEYLQAPDRTRVTVTTEPHGDTTTHEVEAFVRERSGMTLGWTGSFDALETLLDPVSAV